MAEDKLTNDPEEPKEKRARLVQCGIECLKAQYDFYKHFMTLSLTTLAATGALAGGIFGSVSNPLVFVIIVFALSCTIAFTIGGMNTTKNNLWAMRDVTNDEEFDTLQNRWVLRKWLGLTLTVIWFGTVGSYIIAVLLLLLFVYLGFSSYYSSTVS